MSWPYEEIDMRVFCEVFRSLGFKRIEAEFNGYGDSGTIESISIVDNSGKFFNYGDIDFNKIFLESNKAVLNSFNNEFNKIISKYKTLSNYLEEVVWTLLPSGFEINEGSYGTLDIDLKTGKTDLDQNYNPEYDGDDSEII